jgi:hypothetical protein
MLKLLKINNRGVSEIISYVFISLIIVVIVGIFLRTIVPIIEEGQEKATFEKSQNYIVDIENTIKEILTQPVNSTKQLHLNLKDLSLYVDSNTDKIEIVQTISYDIFKDDFNQSIDSTKYNYRKNQELYCVLDFEDVDIIRSRNVENKNITLYIKKIDRSTINISLSKEDDDYWFGLEFTNTGFSYSNVDQQGEWFYRKLITIDNNKIEGDLNSFPILIDLNADKDLYKYAKEDGSDIIFTDSSANKLYREIEVFDKYTLFRKKIIIDHTKVDGDLTNFPMLINITDSDLSTYSNEFGSDIYFEDSNGNRLKREIEDFNKETGDLTAWVKIPDLLDSEDTKIYMYFGNPYAGEEDSTEVWDDSFAVYHFNGNTNDSLNTSDGNESNVTLTTNRFGKENSAYYFNSNTDSYINITNPINQNNLEQEWTVTAWYYLEDKTGRKRILDGLNRGLFAAFSSERPLLYLNSGDNDYYIYGTHVDVNRWDQMTFTFKNSNGYRHIYLNGENIDSSGPNKTSTPAGISGTLKIGCTFLGSIDSLRIYEGIRSPEWISTEYNNQKDPSSFYNIEDKEDLGNYAKLTAWVKIPEIRKDQDNMLYIYFGNDLANETNSTKVWDANYMMIQHLEESPENNILEGYIGSTKNYIKGKALGFDQNVLNNTNTLGKIGLSDTFSNTNDNYIEFEYNNNLENLKNKRTISVWIYFPGQPNPSNFLDTTKFILKYRGDWAGNKFYNLNRINESESPGDSAWAYTSGVRQQDEFIIKKWYYLVGTTENNNMKLYLNGMLKRELNCLDGYTLKEGTSPYIFLGKFLANIDEVRISKTNRSQNWIKTEYNNQNDPNSFYNIGDLEKK